MHSLTDTKVGGSQQVHTTRNGDFGRTNLIFRHQSHKCGGDAVPLPGKFVTQEADVTLMQKAMKVRILPELGKAMIVSCELLL